MPEEKGEHIVSEQQKKAQQEPDLNQLRKVRREKLADLQANGKTHLSLRNMTRHITVWRSKRILKNLQEKKFLSQDV